MDRKTLLAIVLCFGIYLSWQKLYVEPRLPAPEILTPASPPTTPVASQIQATTHATATAYLPISIGSGEAVVTNGSYFFQRWTLKNYKLTQRVDAAAVDLESVVHQPGMMSLAFDLPELAYINEVVGKLEERSGSLHWEFEDAQVQLSRDFVAAPDQPYLSVRIQAHFKNLKPRYAYVSLSAQGVEDAETPDRNLVLLTDHALKSYSLKDRIVPKQFDTPVQYIGATSRYFIATIVHETAGLPGKSLPPTGLLQPIDAHTSRASLVYPITNGSIDIPLRAYFGAKELAVLQRVDPDLNQTVDFGWFTSFAYPLLRMLNWLYGFTRNYGVAIILLTLLLKILTYPLTYKSMKSMKSMAAIQPELTKLREKYKEDKQQLNLETIALMRQQGYNPVAGCLPLLIQMPIFLALYRVLYSSIELYQAPFALWIRDLSQRDPFYVTPLLLTATMFFQQKLTPTTTTDPAQAKMMQFMPLLFGGLMITVPAGLTLYMWINALASIGQTLILNRKLDSHRASHPIVLGLS